MLRYYIMADLGKTLNELFELNEDEKFYKDYFEVSASSSQLKKFLENVDSAGSLEQFQNQAGI